MASSEIVEESQTDTIITKETLRAIHEQQLLDGENNDDNTLLFIKAMGGMDIILDKIFQNESFTLQQEEMDRMYQIMSTPSIYQIQKKNEQNMKIALVQIPTQHKENDDKVYFVMDESDTYLLSIFGEKYANIILNTIHNKCMLMFMLLWFMVDVIWRLVSNGTSLWFWIHRIIVYTFLIIPFTFIALSVNRKAFKSSLKTTDFWLKNIYFIILLVCSYWMYLNGAVYPILAAVGYTLVIIWCMILMVIISSFDGFHGKRIQKIAISATVGIISLYLSISYQFISYTNSDDSIIHIYGNFGFSIISMMTTSVEVPAIFFLKQSILTYIRKEKSVTIISRPFLIWTNTTKITSKLSEVIENELMDDNEDHKEMEILEIKANQMYIKKEQNEDLSISRNIDNM
eukprot:125772_1